MKSLKKKIQADFDFLQKMTIPEFTLFNKWAEVNKKQWTTAEQARLWEIKNSLWYPNNPDDYLKLQPKVVLVKTKEDSQTWTLLRTFTSTMKWNQNVGRIMRYTIMDKKTLTYLGVISLASDFISLGPRDSQIGWTYNHRIKQKMLAYTAMGSSIVPTQPLGFNYVGGKLISLLVCSDKVVDPWNAKYKENLAALTTTSLYGGFSQYNRLKHWKKCGTTEGKIPMEPSEDTYLAIREWVKKMYPKDFLKLTQNKDGKILSRPKAKMLSFAYTKLQIKPPNNDAPRGVYLCNLNTTAYEFLRKESDTMGEKLFDNKLKTLVDLWKTKYAKKRVEGLLKNGRYNTDSLFYDALIGKTWEEAREAFLSKVKS